jgi:tartrate-resistant acid phosphatase type 5
MTGRPGTARRARVPPALALAVALAAAIAGCGRTTLEPSREGRPDPLPPTPLRPPHPVPSRPVPSHPVPSGPVLVRFAVIGDYGVDAAPAARVARMVAAWSPDFVITTGDNNYPSGAAATIDANVGKHYARFIGNYRGTYGPGGPVNRFWPSPGNHDWDAGSLAPYLDYFTLPGNGRYYDVVIGPIHLYAVDSDPREPDGTAVGSAQARWLQTALTSSSSCFDVVYFHHPAYSSGFHGSTLEMRWPFESWGADVVFTGHDHTYERAKVGGIRYVTVGVSGNELYPFNTPIPESEVRFSSRHGALLATAREDGISFQFFTDDGVEVDSYSSFKPCRR